MITALALAVYAALAGVAAPYGLARARWAHQAPRIAVLAWLGLMATFVVAASSAVYHVMLVEQHVHDGLVGLLSLCGVPGGAPAGDAAPTVTDVLLLLPPALVVLLPAGWLLHGLWRSRRFRRRHLDLLALVGRPAPEYGATVVDHDAAAVYCLPGRSRRIVVTQGALDALTDDQLRAVLDHERAHIAGRHHLLHAAARAFARAFPGLPLARLAREHTTLLLEMAADDRALSAHPREVLATAMCEVAAGQTPQAALGAGGPGALIRLRRVLAPPAKPRRVTGLGLVVGSVAAPLLPLLVACGPAVG
ncbi:M56 family metallopeptidase [Streptomyces sp. NPDC051940]|uniref:M56 family metallopeptidase n=1 Tax=Streptomyces sp. NPDC051940 TaxID=3155675 RepID=UPI003423951A